MVLRGLTTIWSLATLPTSRSPFSLTATTEGRMSDPLSLGTTRATLLRTYATQVLVVPRSMPSRIGLSGAMSASRCYGAARPGGKKAARALARSWLGHALWIAQEPVSGFQLDGPFLVGLRQLVDEPAGAHEHPGPVAVLGHHRIGQVQLVLG